MAKKHHTKTSWKKISLYSSLSLLAILPIAAVVSCTQSSSNTTTSNSTPITQLNTYDGKKGFTSNLSINDIASDALLNSTTNSAWMAYKTDELIYSYFKNSTNKTIQSLFTAAQNTATNAYNKDVTNYKSEYGDKWQYYVQTNLFDAEGGTKQSYLLSQMASTLLSDFKNLIFGGNLSGFKSLLGFWTITKTNHGNVSLLPMDQWTDDNSSNVSSSSFINNPINWAGNKNDTTSDANTSLGFFPNVFTDLNSDQQTLYLHLANFDQFVFDQWIIHDEPFIASSILYQYYTKNSSNNLDASNSIYNTKYFTSLPTSNNLEFPQFGSIANNQFDSHLYDYLQPISSSNPDGFIDSNGTYVSPSIDNWVGNTEVYNNQQITGGFNFYNLGNVGNTQTGYFMTNGASIASSSSSSYEAYSSYLPSYSAAALSRYNMLMFDNNSNNALPTGIGGSIINGISYQSLNKDLLSNFLYSYGTNNDGNEGQFYPSYLTAPTNSFDVINPHYTNLLYNGIPLNSNNMADFWNTNILNPYKHDTMSILSFNVLFSNNQLSPYIFTRDGDGVHVIAIDGYHRIIAAEQDPSSIASPIDVYPNPTNAYEAGIDALAQDILWRQEQISSNTVTTNIKINLYNALEAYYNANVNSLLLSYAAQLDSNKNDANYNQLFSSGYNLFNNNDISDVFNTNSKQQQATLDLLQIIITQHDYLTEQTNENTFKKQVLQTYTQNTTSNESANTSYGVGTYFHENGIRPAFPYAIDLSTSVIYPYLSYYVYHLSFANTLNVIASANNAGNLYLDSTKNSSANFYNLPSLDQQLTSIHKELKTAITNYFNAMNLGPWSYSTDYANYSQYVFTNNDAVNSAIQGLSNDSIFATAVKNNLLSKSLNVNETAPNANNSVDSNLNDIYGLSNSTLKGTGLLDNDHNYGSNLSYLATAILYQSDLSSFTSSLPSIINYGYNLKIDGTGFVPVSANDYANSIVNLTNSIGNYYLNTNYYYASTGLNSESTNNNDYLTLLQTINYLYDDGSWANLYTYLNNLLMNGTAYVVWANGDSANVLNNANSYSSLTNTGSSWQYADQLNSVVNPNYNTTSSNYGTAGYTSYGNISQFGYSPFNYIPNANLNGDMLSEFMDQQIAATTTNFGTANYAFNNISSYLTNPATYFDLANVNVNGSLDPFTGFIGLQTSNSHTTLTNLQLNTYLFGSANYSINSYGLLANYYNGLGTTTNPEEGTLMYAIMHAGSLAQLISLSSTLQSVNSTIPQFSKQYYSGNVNTQSEVDANYAKAVYKAMVAIPGEQDFFKNFSGYVTGLTNTPSATNFNNVSDMYNVLTGGTNLAYNNLQTSWSQYQSSLKKTNQSTTPNTDIIGNLAQDRLIPNGSGDYITISSASSSSSSSSSSSTSSADQYKFMMYADQISLSSMGPNVWTVNTWKNTTPWAKLGLTEDAFAKLLVQIATNSTLQTTALSAFTNNQSNKVEVYDLRLRNALGILWVLNWVIG